MVQQVGIVVVLSAAALGEFATFSRAFLRVQNIVL